jgi:hypothetical protein
MQDFVPTDQSEVILHALSRYHQCMVAALPDELDALLEPGYSLVHITGYVQPRLEWLAAIGSGEFDYHRIELMQDCLSVAMSGDAATVTGKGVFHATIQGLKAPWRLAFTLQYVHRDGHWRVANARYTTY